MARRRTLTPFERHEIYRLRLAGTSSAEIQLQFGLAQSTIWSVMKSFGYAFERGLDPHVVDRIVEMREGGARYREIAEKFGITTDTAYHHCVRAGIVTTPVDRHPSSFSPVDDRRLIELQIDGHSIAEISRIMGRPYTSCSHRARRLASVEEAA